MGNTITPQPGKRLSALTLNGAYKCLDDMKGDASGMVLDGVTLNGVQQRGINLEKGHTQGFTARNLTITGTEAGVKNGIYPMGIAFKRGRDATLDTVTIAGIKTKDDGTYRQGDGLCCENPFVGIRLNDVTIRDNTDGGLDSKAQRLVSTGTLLLQRNKLNGRIWYEMHVFDHVVSEDPIEGHFQLSQGTPGGVTKAGGIKIKRLDVWSKTTAVIFGLSQGCSIEVEEMSIDVPPGTKLLYFRGKGSKANTTVKLPSYVKVDAKGCVINCTPPSTSTPTPAAPAAQIVDAGQLLPDNSKDGLIKLSSKWAKALGLKTNTVVRHLDGFRYQIVR